MWAGANRPDTDGIDLGQALSTKKEFTLPSIWNPSIASVHSEHHVLTRPEPGRLAYTMTGIAMVRALRAEPLMAEVRVLMLTSESSIRSTGQCTCPVWLPERSWHLCTGRRSSP